MGPPQFIVCTPSCTYFGKIDSTTTRKHAGCLDLGRTILRLLPSKQCAEQPASAANCQVLPNRLMDHRLPSQRVKTTRPDQLPFQTRMSATLPPATGKHASFAVSQHKMYPESYVHSLLYRRFHQGSQSGIFCLRR